MSQIHRCLLKCVLFAFPNYKSCFKSMQLVCCAVDEESANASQYQLYTDAPTFLYPPLAPRLSHSYYMIRYRLQSKLGPVNMPTQNTRLPSTFLSRIHLILAIATSGNCNICIPMRYPRSFLKIHHMTSSWTHADNKKVTSVAVGRESLKALMEE